MSIVNQIKMCPVEVALKILGKKWAIHIIRDMFRGKTRFSDFLELNPKLTTKMLSKRLKELSEFKLIERIVMNKIPVKIAYHLTDAGLALNTIIIELSKFSINEFPEKVFRTVSINKDENEHAIEEAINRFSVINSLDDYSTMV